MLKKFKQATLRSLKTAGVSALVHNSRWRRERLLILAYHGISTDDEHLWNDSMFMSPEMFRARLALIKQSGCTVLPLDEAIKRLYARDLPERSVVITFDDGTQDFYELAFPLLKEFGFPVTVYLSTFYSNFQRPVFDIMCGYLLWKARTKSLDLKELIARKENVNLQTETSRRFALAEIHKFAREQELSAEEKDAFSSALAKQLQVDYEALLARRALHIMTPEEVVRLASAGVDVQFHTHRHRTPTDRELFLREIEDNRNSIQVMTGRRATHFCYPSGVYDQAFLPWLREADISSATTCDLGLASST